MNKRLDQGQTAPPTPPAWANSATTGNGLGDAAVQATSGELERTFQALPIGIATVDHELRVRSANRTFATFSRLPAGELVGRPVEQWLPAFAARLLPALRALLFEAGGTTAFELTEEGGEVEHPRVWEVRLSRLGDSGWAATAVAVMVRDMTSENKETGRRRLELRELDHRLRNVLTVAQSVFRRTAALSLDKAHLVETFTARLDALARASAFLGRERTEEVEIASMVRTALAPFDTERRFEIEGEYRTLPAPIAGFLSLALNELAVNAAKYGALSVVDGRVVVHWHLTQERRLVLDWREENGPKVRPPTRRGFGCELIEEVLTYQFDVEVDLTFPIDGMLCRMVVPLAEEAVAVPVRAFSFPAGCDA
jgi:two-component sensor histidine kinase